MSKALQDELRAIAQDAAQDISPDVSQGGAHSDLRAEISACRRCQDRFRTTKTAHQPRPVPWFRPTARLLIAGQAPGMRVHESDRPFDDRSGDRLRDWLGIDRDQFYDQSQIACVPAAFCFPGYDAKGSDLPPPKLCADTWQDRVMQHLNDVRLTVLVGAYAHRGHLGVKTGVTETVRDWRQYAPKVFVLPHPSWRNTGWIRKNPWFEAELLPQLRSQVAATLTSANPK